MKRSIKMEKCVVFATVAFSLILSSQYVFAQKGNKPKQVDTATIERVMGMKGKSNNGEYKISVPQNDLDVKVDGFKIIPPMGLSTWVAFTPTKNGVMFMGDIIITETDLKPVQQEII